MNYCLINGIRAIPKTDSDIKVTFENPLLKDRDAQTMEIEFPLDIEQNRRLFGSVGRIDVAKRSVSYPNSRLYAGNTLVMTGTATVTSYSDTTVKLQIKAAQGTTDISEDWSEVWIDRITYPLMGSLPFIQSTPSGDSFESSKYELCAVYDETSEKVRNQKTWVYTKSGDTVSGTTANEGPAPQPNFAFVLKTVLARMGYTLNSGTIFDSEPWNRLYILNTHVTPLLRNALPHWSIKKFLTEVKNLFGCSFVFNDNDKTVGVSSLSSAAQAVSYECEDEFSSDYDEEGLEYTGASNLKYNLSDSDAWDDYPDIEEDTLAQFTIMDLYNGYSEPDFTTMTDKEVETTVYHYIFANAEKYFYALVSYDSEGNRKVKLTEIGEFMHLRRQEEGSEVELNIVPAAMRYVQFETKIRQVVTTTSGTTLITKWPVAQKLPCYFTMPSAEGMDKDDTANDDDEDGTSSASLNVKSYVSVKDALDGEEASDDEDERMEVYFLFSSGVEAIDYTTFTKDIVGGTATATYRLAHTIHPNGRGSLSFNSTLSGNRGIAAFHPKEKLINNQEQMVIKFISQTPPDPKKIFLFRGKRFLCDKIEMQIKDYGLCPQMTGYFYEMT